jgi:hypothetical protein
MLNLNVRRIPTWLSVGAALAMLTTVANANTFTIDATWLDGPGTISGSFTMDLGNWNTIANVNVQATLPYTGSNAYGQIATIIDHLTFNSASFVPNATNSDSGYIWLTNTSKPAASYHIALGVTPLPNQQVIMDYNIGTYGAAHASEVQDLTHLWDYFQGTVTDPVTGTSLVASVPEPSTWVMMLVGFLGLGAAARRSSAQCIIRLVRKAAKWRPSLFGLGV